MIDLKLLGIPHLCLRLVSEADDLRRFLIQGLPGESVCIPRLPAVFCRRQINVNRIDNLMGGRHFRSHADDGIILVQFHRDHKGGSAAACGCAVSIAVGLNIGIGITAEYQRRISLPSGHGDFRTGNADPSRSAGPGKFVRLIDSVRKIHRTVHPPCGTTGI